MLYQLLDQNTCKLWSRKHL